MENRHKPTNSHDELDYSKPVISVELDGSHIKIARIKNMELEELFESHLDLDQTKEDIVKQVIAVIGRLFNEEVVGIGIGIPGIVDLEKGIAYNVARINAWDEVHLKAILEDNYKVPTYLNNDANCFALGVKYFGKGKYYHNMVGLIVAGGVGGGTIVDDKLYSGTDCGVGEFGKMPYLDATLEYYTSSQFFKNVIKSDFKTVFQKAKKGDADSLDAFREFGFHLGNGLKIIVYAVNPELIVLGGDLVKAFDYFKESMWETLKTFFFKKTIERVKIEVSDDPNITLLGAAALYYDAQEGKALERERKRRLKAETELLQERNTLSAILENIPDIIYSKDKNKRLTKVNRAFLNHYDLTNEKMVLGKSHHEIFNQNKQLSCFDEADKIFKTAKPVIDKEKKELDKDNKDIWMLTSAIPILDSIGEVSGIVGISRDITERKISEEKLKRFSERLQFAKRETDNILQNVDEGLFLLDDDFKIGSQYSSCLENIFLTKKIAKRNLVTYLSDKIIKDEIETVKRYLYMKFDDSYDEQLIEELTPMNKIKISFSKGRLYKYLSFKFKRIKNTDGQTQELIAVVKDITEQVKLEERLRVSEERAKRQTELILNIIHVEPSMLSDFIEGLNNELTSIDMYFNADVKQNELKSILEKVYRSVHLIKGNASILDLKYFADLAHDFEDKISEIQKKSKITKKDLYILLDIYDDIKKSVDEIKTLISKLSRVHSNMRPKRSYEKKAFIRSIENFLKQSAADKGKKIKLDIKDFDLDNFPYKYKILIKDILIQLVRNSLAHGIESPDERKINGKDEKGLIQISSYEEDKQILLKYRDDGRGIQIEKLRARLKKDKRWGNKKVEKLSDIEISQTIFHSGVSTTEGSDMISGRGVGMDAVREKIEEIKGSIQVDFEKDNGCEFIIRLPKEKNAK